MMFSGYICDQCGKRVEQPKTSELDDSPKPPGWFYYQLHISPNVPQADYHECNATGHACSEACLELKSRDFVTALFGVKK